MLQDRVERIYEAGQWTV